MLNFNKIGSESGPKKPNYSLLKSLALSVFLQFAMPDKAVGQNSTQPMKPKAIPTMPVFDQESDTMDVADPAEYDISPHERSEAEKAMDMQRKEESEWVDRLLQEAIRKYKTEQGEDPTQEMIIFLRKEIIEEIKKAKQTGPIT